MAKDFNSQDVVDHYDVHIRKLIPGYEVVHQQIQALLKTYVNEHAHILIVGCGTGYELGYLLQLFPHWTFTATELSTTMLDKAKHYIQPLNAQHRVEFVLGDVQNLKIDQHYDAALSVLVTHFVKYSEKSDFFSAVYSRLKHQGVFLTFDLIKINTAQESETLKNICEGNGLSAVQAEAMINRLAVDFYPISEAETVENLKLTGFDLVQRFTQILAYQGFIALKH